MEFQEQSKNELIKKLEDQSAKTNYTSDKDDCKLIICQAKAYPAGLVDPRYLPESDTARLQLFAQVMELEPIFTIKLILDHFEPESFQQSDIHYDFVEKSGLSKAKLVFINIYAQRSIEMTNDDLFQTMMKDDGTAQDDEELV